MRTLRPRVSGGHGSEPLIKLLMSFGAKEVDKAREAARVQSSSSRRTINHHTPSVEQGGTCALQAAYVTEIGLLFQDRRVLRCRQFAEDLQGGAHVEQGQVLPWTVTAATADGEGDYRSRDAARKVCDTSWCCAAAWAVQWSVHSRGLGASPPLISGRHCASSFATLKEEYKVTKRKEQIATGEADEVHTGRDLCHRIKRCMQAIDFGWLVAQAYISSLQSARPRATLDNNSFTVRTASRRPTPPHRWRLAMSLPTKASRVCVLLLAGRTEPIVSALLNIDRGRDGCVLLAGR